MLDESLLAPDDAQARGRRWLLLPVSLLVHLLAVAALILVPLLRAGSDLPRAQVTNVFIIAPSLPAPPPPPPPPFGRGGRPGARKPDAAGKPAQRPVIHGRLIAPIEVPVTIEEDEGVDFGVEGGVPWGVVGGVEGGIEGGVVGGVLGGVLGGEIPNEPPVYVSGRQRPKLLRSVTPEFPREAFAERLQGMVIVEAQTDIFGRVTRARIISGPAIFHQPALAAVRQWLYEPYVVDGLPRPIYFTVSITFGLGLQ